MQISEEHKQRLEERKKREEILTLMKKRTMSKRNR